MCSKNTKLTCPFNTKAHLSEPFQGTEMCNPSVQFKHNKTVILAYTNLECRFLCHDPCYGIQTAGEEDY